MVKGEPHVFLACALVLLLNFIVNLILNHLSVLADLGLRIAVSRNGQPSDHGSEQIVEKILAVFATVDVVFSVLVVGVLLRFPLEARINQYPWVYSLFAFQLVCSHQRWPEKDRIPLTDEELPHGNTSAN